MRFSGFRGHSRGNPRTGLIFMGGGGGGGGGFLTIKTLISIYGKKRIDIIDLSYNIEECLAANDYFTD